MSKQGFSLSRLFQRNTTDSESSSGERRKRHRTTPPEGTRVLVVEDSRTIQAIMHKMLIESGYKPIEALDGAAGVALARELRPSLIIMDVVMPGISGFQATRMLRKDPLTATTPVIMISGNQQATDHFWATKIGANDYLVKPFSRQQFFDSIDRVLYGHVNEINDEDQGPIVTPDEHYDDIDLNRE